jgi:hypothetical protein
MDGRGVKCECGCGTELPARRPYRGRHPRQRFVTGHNTGARSTFADTFDEHWVEDKRGCWIWQRGLTSYGYSQLRYGGSPVLGHRFRWERDNGPVPEGEQLHHVCGDRRCVNPAHLELLTAAEHGALSARARWAA